MYLIINADDFGYCPERNRGIIESFKGKSISSSTLLVNSLFAKEAVELALANKLPLGLHFNITEGRPISNLEHVSTLVNTRGLFLGKFGLRDALENMCINLEHVCLFELLVLVCFYF